MKNCLNSVDFIINFAKGHLGLDSDTDIKTVCDEAKQNEIFRFENDAFNILTNDDVNINNIYGIGNKSRSISSHELIITK